MVETEIILRDIHDLDAIPWWPLATGWWWVLGAIVLLLLVAGMRYWLRYSGIMPGWRGDARLQLRDLKRSLRKGEPREVAGRLSILLRRIAIARSGRDQAAGLAGDAWLTWLEQDDRNGFKWSKGAEVLLEAPYMPPELEVNHKEVALLINAAMRWVDTTPSTTRALGNVWLKKLRSVRLSGASNALFQPTMGSRAASAANPGLVAVAASAHGHRCLFTQ